MRSIKNYLNESIENEDYLNESALDMEGDKAEIIKWIRDNFSVSGRLTITKDFVVDCSGSVDVKNESITSLTNGKFKWGKINMNFGCSYCDNLTSLEGAPKSVGRDFDCSNCTKLKSLEGAPEEVGGDFYCGYCVKLETLEGAPKSVGGGFYCESCINLKSLKGAPEKVEGVFNCNYCDKLTSLKGASKNVSGNFECRKCNNLKITDSDRKKYKIIY